MDINKLLSAISKMDKEELEKNIYKAQQILENSDIKKEVTQDVQKTSPLDESK